MAEGMLYTSLFTILYLPVVLNNRKHLEDFCNKMKDSDKKLLSHGAECNIGNIIRVFHILQ